MDKIPVFSRFHQDVNCLEEEKRPKLTWAWDDQGEHQENEP